MNKPWKVILVFVGIFLAGAICGGPVTARWFKPGPPEMKKRVRPQLLERLGKELALTPEQRDRIRPIVSKALEATQQLRKDNLREISLVMDQMHVDLGKELTPEQRTKMEDMRRRFRERAEKMRDEFGDRAPPPPPPEA